MWGPYLPDGKATVDWEKIEAIFIVLGHNLFALSRQTHGRCSKVWTDTFQGIAPNSYHDDVKVKIQNEEKKSKGRDMSEGGIGRSLLPLHEDPYNVSGTWTRVSILSETHGNYADYSAGCLLFRYAPNLY